MFVSVKHMFPLFFASFRFVARGCFFVLHIVPSVRASSEWLQCCNDRRLKQLNIIINERVSYRKYHHSVRYERFKRLL